MNSTALTTAGLLLLLLAALVAPAAAQTGAEGLASQSLRPYAHVFVAYALAWAVVLGWVIWIGRRWARVEEELEDDAGEA